MKEKRIYELDIKQGDFPLFDILSMEELYSLLKSNKFTWNERHFITHMYIPQRKIREFVPVIMLVGVTRMIMDILHSSKREKNND